MKHLSKTTGLLLGAVLFLGVGLAGPAHAQRGMLTPDQMKARMTTEMEDTLTRLGLDEATTAKVRPILMAGIEKRLALFREMREMRKQGGGNRGARGAMREKMMKLEEETENELADVLSEEQMAKYREIVAGKRAARRGGPRRGQ
ncbi:hypothetical protein [Rhodocaloribacter sp.]